MFRWPYFGVNKLQVTIYFEFFKIKLVVVLGRGMKQFFIQIMLQSSVSRFVYNFSNLI